MAAASAMLPSQTVSGPHGYPALSQFSGGEMSLCSGWVWKRKSPHAASRSARPYFPALIRALPRLIHAFLYVYSKNLKEVREASVRDLCNFQDNQSKTYFVFRIEV